MRTLAIAVAATAALSLTALETASARSFEKQEKIVSNGFTTCKITKVTATDDFGDSSQRTSKVCKDNFTAGGGGGGGFGGSSQRPQPTINININAARDRLR
jgi:hypothetical protein